MVAHPLGENLHLPACASLPGHQTRLSAVIDPECGEQIGCAPVGGGIWDATSSKLLVEEWVVDVETNDARGRMARRESGNLEQGVSVATAGQRNVGDDRHGVLLHEHPAYGEEEPFADAGQHGQANGQSDQQCRDTL